MKAKQADVIYTTTDEEETIDLEELMKDRCIALSEPPPRPPKPTGHGKAEGRLATKILEHIDPCPSPSWLLNLVGNLPRGGAETIVRAGPG